MKSLKESLLNEVSNTSLIEKWLKRYNIKNYTITADGKIDVDGDVFLDRQNLKELPDYIQFNIVKGSFDCSRNNLTTLNGTPKEVKEYFFCSFNNLTSLQGCSRKVRGIFDCSYNQLTSLEGAPEEVGRGFYCTHNHTQFTENDVRKVCNVRRLIIC